MSGDKDSPKTPPEWLDDLPIGQSLREYYQDVLNEPVPEKLKQLIEALKDKERKESDKGNEE